MLGRCLYFLLLIPQVLNAQIITLAAGSGTGGDGGPATAAQMSFCQQVTTDAFGNFYFAEFSNHRIRKVNAGGIISTVAGTGASGFNGDGPATVTLLNYPSGITTDSVGNIYFCDQSNNRVRKLNVSTGTITTVAGNGVASFSGDGGPATAAALKNPFGVYFKAPGVLYVSDHANNRVRRVDMAGIITTIAGNGSVGNGGDGGPATAAQCHPTHVCFDKNDNMYISDEGNDKVRKVNPSGIITTVAGVTGSYLYNGDEIPATDAYISPTYIAIGIDNNIYIPDMINNRIRLVDANGIIHTITGTGIGGISGDGGPATAAQIYRPSSVSFDTCGNLFISQLQNARIRKVTYNPTPCPHLGVEEKSVQAMTIYPNPAADELHIEGVTTRSEYVLLNITGIIEQRGIVKKGGNTLPVTYLPHGVYMLLITDEDGKRSVHKVVKQ